MYTRCKTVITTALVKIKQYNDKQFQTLLINTKFSEMRYCLHKNEKQELNEKLRRQIASLSFKMVITIPVLDVNGKYVILLLILDMKVQRYHLFLRSPLENARKWWMFVILQSPTQP